MAKTQLSGIKEATLTLQCMVCFNKHRSTCFGQKKEMNVVLLLCVENKG